MGKGFADIFAAENADIFCLQETKLQAGQIELELPGYHQYWNYAEKKGYSGTAVFSKQEPLCVSYGLGIAEHDKEGRVITLEFPSFYFVKMCIRDRLDDDDLSKAGRKAVYLGSNGSVDGEGKLYASYAQAVKTAESLSLIHI